MLHVQDAYIATNINSLHVDVIYMFSLAMWKLPAISVVILKVEVDKRASKRKAMSVA